MKEITNIADFEIDDYEKSKVYRDVQNGETEGWKIDDDHTADWALRKVAALKQKNKELEEYANFEREKLEKWLSSETENNLNSIEFMEQKLADYLLKKRETDPKARIKLPHGSVSTRKTPVKFIYNEKVVLNNLKKMGMEDYINVKLTLNKAELKKVIKVVNGKAVTADGEILEGVEVEAPSEKVTFKEEL